MENNQSSFWQFSDQLRVQTNTLTNLSLNDSIWSNSYVSKRPENRRNFDLKVGGEINNLKSDLSSEINSPNLFTNNLKADLSSSGFSNDDAWKDVNNSSGFKSNLDGFSNSGFKSDFNSFKSNFDGFNNSGFKSDFNAFKSNFDGFNNSGFITEFDGFSNDAGYRSYGSSKNVSDVGGMGLNGGFNKGVYSNAGAGMNFGYDKGINNVVVNGKSFHSKGAKGNEIYEHGGVGVGGKNGKKNKNSKENNKEGNGENKNALDKRFKTLPPAESLPRNETVGGYIFVCNNDTMQENLKRQLFGLPPRYRDSVRAITPGLPVFLYNYSTHQLHGIFEAASFGGTNIDPTAWEDKKNPGESRFPAQVAVVNRKACEPLEEDSFRPILHHYDGPKFRLELNVPEALSLLDVFYENNP